MRLTLIVEFFLFSTEFPCKNFSFEEREKMESILLGNNNEQASVFLLCKITLFTSEASAFSDRHCVKYCEISTRKSAVYDRVQSSLI